MPGPSLLSSNLQQSSARAPTPTRTPHPQVQAGPPKPNYDAFAALSNSQAVPQSSTPTPTLFQQQQQQSASKPQAPPPPDPFGILSSAPQTKQSSTFAPYASPAPNPLYNPAAAAQNSNANVAKPTNGTSIEDDWNFSSALPEDSLPTSSSVVVSQKEVGIVFDVQRRPDEESIVHVLAKFSNKSANAITEYTFQVAVTKASRTIPTLSIPITN